MHAITVSSVEMARYFAAHGWTDITLAFSVNLRQLQELNELAGSIRLGILVESIESVNALAAGMSNPADLWIKVDVGNHRTGLAWDALDAILAVARAIQPVPHLRLCGLLTHSGHTYGITEPQEIHRIFRQGVERLQSVRDQLASSGMDGWPSPPVIRPAAPWARISAVWMRFGRETLFSLMPCRLPGGCVPGRMWRWLRPARWTPSTRNAGLQSFTVGLFT